MPENISLLPEELRKKEEERTSQTPKASDHSELKFTVPTEEAEDVEVIEVDEGEVDQVLATEPGVAKFVYRFTSLWEGFKAKLFGPAVIERPPKLPPQFFTPPQKSETVLADGAGQKPVEMASTAKPNGAVVKPFATVPKRVRVIRRIRKPVRVSFVSDDDLRVLHIDVPKRRFTFIVLCMLFVLLIGGGEYALGLQAAAAKQELAKAEAQFAEIQSQITQQQGRWVSFQHLEPKLKAMRQLLDTHISPTRLFDAIEQNTLTSVSYGSFALTPDHKVSLSVVADSFDSAAAQIAVFEEAPFVKKVEANGYSAKYDPPDSAKVKEVDFQLTLSLADAALLVSAPTATSTTR